MEKYLKAYAKINLFLDVVSKREDGYHELKMVMLPLELHDSILIEPVTYLKDDYITCDHVELQDTKYNLISQTLKMMKEKYGFKSFHNVIIHKEIPISGGLGGGSSNAAAVMRYLNQAKKLKLSNDELINLGLEIGCDVPFCLSNKPAYVEGVGEKLEFIPVKDQYYVVILKPKKGLSTKKVFAEADQVELEHSESYKDVIEALKTGDEDLLAKSVFNSLEKVSIGLVPEIQNFKEMLIKDGFKVVLMSGSGSTVFALTKNKKLASQKYLKYDKMGFDAYLTKTLK